MFTIPCPEEVFITTELSSGFGRRLPCYNTNRCVIVVKEDEREENSPKEETFSQQSAHGDENGAKKNLTLEELKRMSPPGYQKFEAAVGSKGLDEETALQLWEDIFKPLSSFELLKIG